ncbi:MAG: hypothetical protein EGR08_01350 [Prevotella sp.]|nr:hypothetical protein [Prevotella sp.]
MSEEFDSLKKKEKSKFENSTSAESRQFKNQNSKIKTPIALAIHSPLRRGGGSRKAARGWGFKTRKLNIG